MTVMRKLLRRIVILVPAVILQLVWLRLLFTWLSPWAGVISFALSNLSLLVVLYITIRLGESTYKVLWLLVVLTFPLPGTALYLCFGNKRTGKVLEKKLSAAKLPAPTENGCREALASQRLRLAQTVGYLENMTGASLCRSGEIRYFHLGEQMLPAMLAAMEGAAQSIYLEYFIIEPGLMWNSMTEIMARKAAQGVDVRVIYDDLGSISTFSKSDAKALEARGIRCLPFNPLIFVKGTLNYRDHRKMLIVDGTTVFSGGINLADEYINQKEKYGHWKDIGFRLSGSGAESYTAMFLQFWNSFSDSPISSDEYQYHKPRPMNGDGYVLSYYDSPLRDTAASNELYVELLSQARRYAYFYTPYLMLGDALLDAFVRAARRGVDVRLILPGIPDKKLIYRISRSYYPVLLDAGVKIYEYEPGFVHAKACIVDDIAGTIGTVNLDYRSLFLHFENNSLFIQSPVLQDLKADFLNTQTLCRERTTENITMNFGRWLLDGILRIFAPLC